MKPNLFCFGDSYISWERPLYHWTLRFNSEYNVHRLGKPGSSNEEITWQIRQLPNYQQGDRVLFVFAEISRFPKWYWGEHYKELSFHEGEQDYKYNPYIATLLEVQQLKVKQIEDRIDFPLADYNKTSAYDFYKFIPKLNELLIKYRPVYLTWSDSTYKVLKELIDIKVIHGTQYSTVTEETGYLIRGTHIDSHPGEEGGKIWYNTAKELLDR